jgi:hypothetical protein
MGMKRVPRKPEKYETIEIYKSLSRQEGYKLSSDEHTSQFIDRLSLEFKAAKSNPILVHGTRVQAMFEYIVVSLDNVKMLKSEDSGSIHAKEKDIAIPDFRIVDEKGNEFLVEVKNFYQTDPMLPYTLNKEYVNKLARYAEICKLKLKFAIYWSKWNIWSLVPLDKLTLDNTIYLLTLGDACMFNEMHILGDASIGTIPPLSLRLIADENKPRIVQEDGKVSFVIGEVQFLCGDNKIRDDNEKIIAFSLMMFGSWETREPVAEIDNDNLVSFTYEAVPLERTPDQGFEITGELSSMISRQFKWLTAPDGKVEMLGAGPDESFLGKLIPKGYKGKDLPIWQFIIHPKDNSDK